MSALDFVLGAVRDPNSRDLSSTRVSALALVVAGIAFAFAHPSEANTVTALLGGGALAFFSRAKAAPPADGAP